MIGGKRTSMTQKLSLLLQTSNQNLSARDTLFASEETVFAFSFSLGGLIFGPIGFGSNL